MISDSDLLKTIAECERVTCTSKWLIQVIDKKGKFHSAYFAKPPHGIPEIMYETRLDALRAALTSAIESENADN